MIFLYNSIIYRPILNALVYLYSTVAGQDLGIAIILLTILIRLILFPVFHRGARQQTIMQAISPQIKRVQEQYKSDPAKQSRELMKLYRDNSINPFTPILLLIIQLPVLLALFSVFRRVFTPEIFRDLYAFIPSPGQFNELFLGLINLKNTAILSSGIFLVIAAAAAQFIQGKLSLPRPSGKGLSSSERMSRTMILAGPIMTIIIFAYLPSAISLYWLASSVISIIQQIIINSSIHGTVGEIHDKSG